ncbi:polyprenyl synthetase family protein [Ruficoccus sp. ZRK36]|uniref:polyprenyl synthetase family protein n=1 Tax=Ruficoccus sp. ZRK36 TaxID=2866311 RepID=UPI001C73DBA1|nr:farnesyl diphosphate synthase [Ruficoccus sp. ZRK36]QYY34785.1 polyprenyl synthetase family protein [Ruficoccus sp. ZRK36]
MSTTEITDFKATYQQYQQKVENAIDAIMPAADTRPAVLHEAMRYSLQAGGKRIRPVLLQAAHAMFPSQLDPMPACVALECLHTYSLIHDDLPCMDDSDLRRGRPTCHKQFDEETALLAGDALLTWSLWLLAEKYQQAPATAVGLVRDLGDAAGSEKLIGGQMEDLLGERDEPTPERLDFIHRNKTGALITASLTMGIRLTDAPAETVEVMRTIGHHVGLAFQIIDDILDATADAETLGKPVGADAENNKSTYPALYGLEASRAKAHEHSEAAVSACEKLGGNNAFLIALIREMEKRVN